MLIKRGILRQIRHLGAHVLRIRSRGLAEHERLTLVGLKHANKGEQGCGLAGAVAAEQDEHLALPGLEIEPGEHRMSAAADVEIVRG